MSKKHLARISHTRPTAAADLAASTALRSIGLLDVLFKYACGALGRAPCSCSHLRRLATASCEKCGLAVTLLTSVAVTTILAFFLAGCLDTRADQRLAPELEALAKDVLTANNCGRCHTLQARGLNLTGKVGPNLTREARRNRSPEWLRKQITDPTSVTDAEVLPRYQGKQHLMPSFDQLTQQELAALVEFLRTLR